jgi:hypothetical protein
VHRADGTPVVETAADEEGRYWAYATLNDAFTLRRKCRQEDAIFGLGEKGGRHNRKGRDFTMWNIDVLSPFSTREFTEGRRPTTRAGDRSSADFDPFYASIPFFYHQDYPTGGWRVVRRQLLPRRLRVLPPPTSTGSTSAAGSTRSTSSPDRTCRPSCPRTPG